MRYLAALPLMLASTTAWAMDAQLHQTLIDAHATKDAFIIEAVRQKAVAQYPDMESEITTVLKGGELAPVKSESLGAEKRKRNIIESTWLAEEFPWFATVDGTAEFGASFESGNTDAQDLNASVEFTKTHGRYEHTLTASAEISEENDVTTDEEYEVGLNSRYNWSDIDYAFAELEYRNDRFGGFEYRISELVGYGRKLHESQDMLWEAEAGVGLQQTNPTSGSNDNSWLARGTTRYEWEFTEGWEFETELTSSLSKDNIFTEWDSGLKTALMDNLFLKFGVNVDHTSDVPAGTKHYDTESRVNVVYEF